MRTVSIFKNGNNRDIHLPRDLDFERVRELEDRPRRRQHHPASRPAELGLIRAARKSRSGFYGGARRMLSATKVDLTCEQNVYARHLYLLVHHAQAAGNCAEAP